MRSLLITGVVIATLSIAAPEVQAQFQTQNRIQSYSNQAFQSTAQRILSRPTTSPYLSLVANDITGQGQGSFNQANNYFTQVRPALERQQQQQLQQRQIQNIQRNVSQMRSEAARRSVTGARATGHPTRFNFYLQYYPTLNRR